tara:strand:- start:149 stop:514 length:366 start_codon:yes stop_codon:yes gene_type:complete
LIHYIVNPDSRKSIDWRGSTLKDIRNDKIFSYEARKQAGHQLSLLQAGLEPDNWKPLDNLGPGIKEIRIRTNGNAYRIVYLAKFSDCIYILHCFKKTTQVIKLQDRKLIDQRYKAVLKECQ